MIREFEHFLYSRVYRVQNELAYGRLPVGLIAKYYISVLHQLIVMGLMSNLSLHFQAFLPWLDLLFLQLPNLQ